MSAPVLSAWCCAANSPLVMRSAGKGNPGAGKPPKKADDDTGIPCPGLNVPKGRSFMPNSPVEVSTVGVYPIFAPVGLCSDPLVLEASPLGLGVNGDA